MVRLTQVIYEQAEETYSLTDIYVNPGSVTYMVEDRKTLFANAKKPLVEGLSRHHSFTKLIIDIGGKTEHISVVGDLKEVANKLKTKKELLRG